MNRYWDLSERERAELTSEMVDSMLSVELMERGVTRVDPPVLLPVEVPSVPRRRLYAIKRNSYSMSDVAYESAELAAKAVESGLWLSHEYIGDESIWTVSRETLSIDCIEVADVGDMARVKSENDKAKANKKANDAALKDYKAGLQAVEEACEGVWEDWRECRAKQASYQRIIDTLKEYTAICEGDERKAGVFLAKAFKSPDIAAAREWFGLNVAAAPVEEALPI